MKFEMTRCNKCGSEMLMGADICPGCGQAQSRSSRSVNFHQPRTLLAVGLAAAVLLFFNWINPRAPPASQGAPPPVVGVPSR
jgi:hypothetical protein